MFYNIYSGFVWYFNCLRSFYVYILKLVICAIGFGVLKKSELVFSISSTENSESIFIIELYARLVKSTKMYYWNKR